MKGAEPRLAATRRTRFGKVAPVLSMTLCMTLCMAVAGCSGKGATRTAEFVEPTTSSGDVAGRTDSAPDIDSIRPVSWKTTEGEECVSSSWYPHQDPTAPMLQCTSWLTIDASRRGSIVGLQFLGADIADSSYTLILFAKRPTWVGPDLISGPVQVRQVGELTYLVGGRPADLENATLAFHVEAVDMRCTIEMGLIPEFECVKQRS